MFCDFALLAEFDPVQDHGWVALVSFALFFGVSLWFALVDKGKRIGQSTLQLLLAQLIFVPLGVWLTLWCYQHPKRLAADPDGYLYDMRVFWPFFALFEGVLILWFVRIRWWSWEAKAQRLMQRAQRLLTEGRTEEADAAYAEGRWILDHKCKRN